MTQYIPTFESMMRQMVQYLPAILITLSLIMTYVILIFTGRKLLLRGKLVAQPPSLSYLRFPQEVLAVSGTVIFVGLVFQTQMDEFVPLLANNGLVLMAFLSLIQDLAVVDFFSPKLRMFRLLKTILLTMIIFIPLVQVPAACLGLLDSLLNLRRIHLK